LSRNKSKPNQKQYVTSNIQKTANQRSFMKTVLGGKVCIARRQRDITPLYHYTAPNSVPLVTPLRSHNLNFDGTDS